MTRRTYVLWLGLLATTFCFTTWIALSDMVLPARPTRNISGMLGESIASGHLRLIDYELDATAGVKVETVEGPRAAVVIRDAEGEPIAWMLSAAEAHLRMASVSGARASRARYRERHMSELRTTATVEGWLVNERSPRPLTIDHKLTLDRPLDPMAVAGRVASVLLLLLVLVLVTKRRRWLEAQQRWALNTGVGPLQQEQRPHTF